MSKNIPIATCSDTLEASMIQMELESSEINCELENEFTVGVNPLLANAVGGIKITVSIENAENASRVLAKHYENKAKEEAERAKICPRCKNNNGQSIKRPHWVGIITVLTLGAFSVFYAWPKYECPDCRNKWA
jgi:hypothetical protein